MISAEQYENFLKEIKGLMDAEPGSLEEERLCELCNAVIEYEDTFYLIDNPKEFIVDDIGFITFAKPKAEAFEFPVINMSYMVPTDVIKECFVEFLRKRKNE